MISAFDIAFLGTNLGVFIITYLTVSVVLVLAFNCLMAAGKIKGDVVTRAEIARLSNELNTLNTIREINSRCKAVEEASRDIMPNLEELFLNQAAFGQNLFDLNSKVDSQGPGPDTYPGQ